MFLVTKRHTTGILAGLTTTEKTSVHFFVGERVNRTFTGGSYTVIAVRNLDTKVTYREHPRTWPFS